MNKTSAKSFYVYDPQHGKYTQIFFQKPKPAITQHTCSQNAMNKLSFNKNQKSHVDDSWSELGLMEF